MKKTYIQPVLEVVKLKNSMELLAGSQTLGVGSGTLSADEALGRDFDFNFDEEEY